MKRNADTNAILQRRAELIDSFGKEDLHPRTGVRAGATAPIACLHVCLQVPPDPFPL